MRVIEVLDGDHLPLATGRCTKQSTSPWNYSFLAAVVCSLAAAGAVSVGLGGSERALQVGLKPTTTQRGRSPQFTGTVSFLPALGLSRPDPDSSQSQ